MHDVAIIGGGIVGLSVGYAILRRAPKTSVLVLEKEARCGHLQNGYNSGEIHSGIYYAPRSLKATLCREGNRSMVAFCRQYGIAHDVCGKVVVAVEESELPALTRLRQRAQENGIPVIKVPREMLRYIEPHCAGIAALHVPTTGIVDYQKVAEQLAELIRKHDGEVRLRSEAREVALADDGLRIETPSGTVAARFAINCGGLHSDRIAAAMGVRTGMRIVPIRGTYYRVAEPKRHLVRTLIYPVPNPRYPFLGVHLNRHLDGSLRVGPNALMCFKREGYRSGEVSVRDAAELLCS